MIETGRLVLRRPVAEDLAWIAEALNTRAVLRHLGGEPRDLAAVSQALAADISAFGSGGHLRWTVWHREDAVRIGRCGLFLIRSAAAPEALRGQHEIGWTFSEPFWGRGYASEAARAVIDWHFANRSVDQLWSQTSDSNLASTRMMARLGFERCAALDYVDPDYPAADNPTTVYRLTRGGWAISDERGQT